MPPAHHRHARHAMHGKPPHHPSRFSNLQGNVANQLNQEELARLQARYRLRRTNRGEIVREGPLDERTETSATATTGMVDA